MYYQFLYLEIVFINCFKFLVLAKVKYFNQKIKNLILQPIGSVNYAVFKLTAEGPLGPSSTSKVKA
jgi:hypothetical protein